MGGGDVRRPRGLTGGAHVEACVPKGALEPAHRDVAVARHGRAGRTGSLDDHTAGGRCVHRTVHDTRVRVQLFDEALDHARSRSQRVRNGTRAGTGRSPPSVPPESNGVNTLPIGPEYTASYAWPLT